MSIKTKLLKTYAIRFQTSGNGGGSIYAGGQLIDAYSYTDYITEGESFFFQACASEGSKARVLNAGQTGGANEYVLSKKSGYHHTHQQVYGYPDFFSCPGQQTVYLVTISTGTLKIFATFRIVSICLPVAAAK